MVEVVSEVRPRWPFRLPGFGGRDGILRAGGGGLARLLHVDDEPAVVRVRQPARERVLFTASALDRATADEAVARMRFALAVDDDLRPFYERFRLHPLLGRAVRARPGLRVRRRPEPFEALAWAICEQLIEAQRAAAIQRRIVRRWGRRCPRTGLRDAPTPARLAGVSAAELEALDLAHGRALALRRAAREVAAGRADLRDGVHERGWARLRTIPGIGAWTVECLALHGQGRYDQLPAGDLAYLKLVGRLRSGDPGARADEAEVREFFAPYAPWAGLAGAHLLGARRMLPARLTGPAPGGTRSSGRRPRWAAA